MMLKDSPSNFKWAATSTGPVPVAPVCSKNKATVNQLVTNNLKYISKMKFFKNGKKINSFKQFEVSKMQFFLKYSEKINSFIIRKTILANSHLKIKAVAVAKKLDFSYYLKVFANSNIR